MWLGAFLWFSEIWVIGLQWYCLPTAKYLNGADHKTWNPATDTNIAASYSPRDLSGKGLCKKDLLKEMGLPNDLSERPLIGMVTRLFDQKGYRLVAEAAEELFAIDLGLVLLAAGEVSYQELFTELQAQHPSRFGLKLGFDPVLSHKIFAGCDMFLMPSLYEPCGLTQMYSLRYGTIPIVRATGGLQDTVIDPNEANSPGTGFKFYRFHKDDLMSHDTSSFPFSHRQDLTNAASSPCVISLMDFIGAYRGALAFAC